MRAGAPVRGGKVFISYRREGGGERARLVRDWLRRHGYRVFLDVEDLGHGHFDAALLAEIESSSDLVVILTPGALDRCEEEGDWLREEVSHAIRLERNVVPMFTPDFEWPSRPLPDQLATLPIYNGTTTSHVYFESSMERLAALLLARPRRRHIGLAWVATAVVTLLAGAALGILLSQRRPAVDIAEGSDVAERPSSSVDTPADGYVGTAVLPRGNILFRSERLEPLPRNSAMSTNSPERRMSYLARPGGTDEVELAFQLANHSPDETVFLSSLQVVELGKLTLHEDDQGGEVNLSSVEALYKMSYSPTRTDLGLLVFSLNGDETARSTGTGSLLSRDRTETLGPSVTRSFLLRLCCAREEQGRVVRELEPEACPPGVDGLDGLPPREEVVAHVFVVAVDMLTSDGHRARLYSDWIYALYPEIQAPLYGMQEVAIRRLDSMSLEGKTLSDVEKLRLSKWEGMPPGEFIGNAVGWALRSYSETLAFQVAQKYGQVPEGFYAGAVSPYCYYGDEQSPFRGRPPRVDDEEGAASRLSFSPDPWPLAARHKRSNIADLITAMAEEHPPLWRMVREEVVRLAAEGRFSERRKAQYLAAELAQRGLAMADNAGVAVPPTD